jgi:hypothetical protein
MPSDLLPSGNEVETTGLIRTAAGIQKVLHLMKREAIFANCIVSKSAHSLSCHAARRIVRSIPDPNLLAFQALSEHADNLQRARSYRLGAVAV